MSTIPAHLKYTDTHEWVLREPDGTWVVGITDHAQTMLGEVVFVELPEDDIEVEADDELVVLESVKAAADVFSPVTGVVTEVNMQLVDRPDFINKAPFEEGWLFKIAPHDESAYDDLLDVASYQEVVRSEAH